MTANKFDLLRSFVRVTEVGSFTQAAALLGLQKASVSEHVRALEELVGARLLHRTTRKVQPTHDGMALFERCKDLLSDMDELEGMFRRDDAALSGRLRVDMPTAVAHKIVMPHLAEFVARYPHVQIEISSADRRVDVVREGFDCVLRVGDTVDPSLIARKLGAFQMVNCASPAYLKQYGTPQSPDDLAMHQLVHYTPVLGMRSSGFEYVVDGKTIAITMSGAVTVNNVEAYEAACLGGLGIVQSPLSGLREHIKHGRLVSILPQFIPAPMTVSLLYSHRRHLPQRVRIFMDWLAELMEQHYPFLK